MVQARDARVVILHDAVTAQAPPDQLDTLVQVGAVGAALCTLGYGVQALPVAADLEATAESLRARAPALVLNLVESGSATNDKLLAKRIMCAGGIPTPPWLEVADLRQSIPGPYQPYIVKCATEHASLGLAADSVVTDPSALGAIISQRAERFGGTWFAERYVEGRELNVAVVEHAGEPQVLPLAEMEFVDFPENLPRIVDYAAKWEPESFAYRHTRRRFERIAGEPDLAQRLGALALACWRRFSLSGYARVDIRLDREGRPWVLEVNANPCLAPEAGFAAAAARAGLGYEDVISRIVTAAERRLARAMHAQGSSLVSHS